MFVRNGQQLGSVILNAKKAAKVTEQAAPAEAEGEKESSQKAATAADKK